ncbi:MULTISPECIES: hypothetical protein [Aeromonas]|jgi:hypothetical protein|uniref:DUF5666 domain-containing protein n=5 Tax=Bacteria TaxID=2 RepID=A4SSI9_AERS4|nr:MULTISPECIES: hypothetical protein [Aeromonas]MBP6141435.1 hypothetical protein [Aeromonas sp.]ABO91861.1 conserved hypothetical protein [Aeromonas salmonicida subsp. salmonicida A449]ARW84832.1 putative lipoprotein [Aeromonas salmonicida]ASI24854.1 hypothetical protein CE456_21795 [Aeromonas salmonicida]ASI29173.1 hypothetical protein CE463_21790 [Aeromonas salmonicida]
MKKSLCALLLFILLPLGTAQSAEFKLTGRTTWQLGQLMVNGIPFVLDEGTRFKDGLSEDDLGGRWVDLEGVVEEGLRVIREVEALDEEDEMELEGPVAQGRIWGYVTSDNSLAPFEGRWLELECKFDGMRLSRCRQDD